MSRAKAKAEVASLSVTGPPVAATGPFTFDRAAAVAEAPREDLVPLDPYDEDYTRIIGAWAERTKAPKTGAFFLLYPDAPEWSKASPVVGEPAFEAEWRKRVAGSTNPDATLVILPWG